LIEGYGLVIFDECHHLRGDSWHGTMMDFRCRYRMGLSATVYLDSEREQERGVIWLRACCGNIKYEVSTSLLIEQGYLMRQHVELYSVDKPDRKGEPWSSELRDYCVYENPYRNRKIVRLAQKKLAKGLNVMIVTNRLNQIALLSDMLEAAGIEHVTVTGRDSSETRTDRVELFTGGHAPVILGTVFGEGIDIPEVEVVINAEGGKDMKATVQRMRNMTPSEGKTRCVLVDFADSTNKYFHDHYKARLATYESESAFVVKKMWLKKDSTPSHGPVR
jgi:superfamily II DNA or RNA helicase